MGRRCGICRQKGHNRQTCKVGSKPAVTYTASITPQDSGYIVTSDRTVTGRRKPACSYCMKRDFRVDRTHTTRTCQNRKIARDAWIEENSSWAVNHRLTCMKEGLGVGSIVEYGETAYVIDSIDFDYLSKDRDHAYIGISILDLDSRYPRRTRISVSERDHFKVLSPISAEMVNAAFPKNWDYGTCALPLYLRDAKEKRKKR